MEYINYDMNAYKLHIIKTDKFKTITVSVAFRRKIVKEEITIRNLLKDLLINASYNYPTEKSLIIETEKLYDLKLMASNYRIGNYAVMAIKTRFLNEKYTESGMNEESIKFLLDLIFNPKFDSEINKCKKMLIKNIKSLSDNKIKYSILKLLSKVEDRPYSYNSYGYIEDLEKITIDNLQEYYNSIIKDDIVDVFIVGDISEILIKKIFKEYFKVGTYHKHEVSLLVPELIKTHKIEKYKEQANVSQTQLVLLYSIKGLTDKERKYVLPVYSEMLGGSANSILFSSVREKNSYAYYVNSLIKPYDNIMIIYAGIDGKNQDNVQKIILKSLKNISKGQFDETKFTSAKKTIVSSIEASLDSPIGIINNCYAMTLVNSKSSSERIKNIMMVTKDDVISVGKKISLYSSFILEATNEENND